MNEEIKIQWIDALLSGEFTRGESFLNSDGKLCPLGVLCELAVRAGATTREGSHSGNVIMYGHQNHVLPDSVVSWAGLPDRNPTLLSIPRGSLADLNDDGMTFAAIADLIKDKL
jgi:hypothetical protein